jgi:hypothetical protein
MAYLFKPPCDRNVVQCVALAYDDVGTPITGEANFTNFAFLAIAARNFITDFHTIDIH